MTRKQGTHGGPSPARRNLHPHSVAILETDALPPLPPDLPFVEGQRDAIDPDLRHRLISEAAFRMYEARGYADGSDVDDWLSAEAEVDHMLEGPDEQDMSTAH